MRQVKTAKGIIEGIEKSGYSLFLGIPYAKPPIDGLRWQPPQEMDPWADVFHADHFPNRCTQFVQDKPDFYEKEFYDDPAYQTPLSEDCLYLNIWTPAKEPGEKLPVAFWIHGGGFMGGYGHEKEFDGKNYCARGILLVTINYRLGVLGFLAHPWLSAEAKQEGRGAVSGNYGILDQIAALRWVRENIAAFGGDPDNITVFGQSAGCMSVQTLLSSPLTEGMIHKAILQSGIGISYDHTLEKAEKEGAKIVKGVHAKSLAELRQVSFDQLMKASLPLLLMGVPKGKLVFTPVIDNMVLVEGYNQRLEAGRVHNIPTIVGSNTNDLGMNAKKLKKGDKGTLYHGCEHWGDAMVKNGRGPAFVYYFTRPLPGDDAGAFHSAELWYMFGTLDRCWRPITEHDRELSRQMLDYWTNFMKSGDPNGEGLAMWKPYQSNQNILEFC